MIHTDRLPFSIGIITDEVSQDLSAAAEFMTCHGLTEMEIRSANGRGVFEFTQADIDAIREVCERFGLHVTAFSSPTYKCDFSDEQAILQHQQGFLRCAEYAKQLGAKMIRVFDFWESGVSIQERAAKFEPLIRICEAYDLYCVMEYDPSVHSNTPEKTAALLRTIDHPRVRGLFDPGNGIWSVPKQKPYPEGYHLMKPYLAHIHVKDATLINGKPEAVKVGTGQVDYRGLFSELIADGYSGAIMLETHYRLNSSLTEEQLKRPGGSAFSDGAYAASEESMNALEKIVEQLTE